MEKTSAALRSDSEGAASGVAQLLSQDVENTLR
jgi:hypothetical protein